MGKASQAKKAARLARESGQVEERKKRRLGFPLAVVAAVAIGVIVVALARKPASTPKLTIDPTTVGADPTAPADGSSTTVVSGAADAVPSTVTTAVAGQ